MYSYWEKKYWYPSYDNVIIGAGIVGLSTALELRRKFPNESIIIIDKYPIPQGASTKNAGFACFGSIGEIMDDLNELSEQEIIDLIKLRWTGLELLKQNIPPNEMAFSNKGGKEIFLDEKSFENCSAQLTEINRLMYDAIGISEVFKVKSLETELKNTYSKCIFNEYESQLNPVKLIKYLLNQCALNNIETSYSSEVTHYEKSNATYKLFLNADFSINAHRVVICNNAFANELVDHLDIKPARNQVIVTEPIPNLKLNGTYHFDKGYTYFRDIDNSRILIGGARNLEPEKESTKQFGTNERIVQHLKSFVETHITEKEVKIDFQWNGIIATGTSKNAIIKEIDDRLYIAVRLGGMGIAIGSAVAQTVVEVIEDILNK